MLSNEIEVRKETISSPPQREKKKREYVCCVLCLLRATEQPFFMHVNRFTPDNFLSFFNEQK